MGTGIKYLLLYSVRIVPCDTVGLQRRAATLVIVGGRKQRERISFFETKHTSIVIAVIMMFLKTVLLTLVITCSSEVDSHLKDARSSDGDKAAIERDLTYYVPTASGSSSTTNSHSASQSVSYSGTIKSTKSASHSSSGGSSRSSSSTRSSRQPRIFSRKKFCEHGSFPVDITFETDANGNVIPPGAYLTDLNYGFTLWTDSQKGAFVANGPRVYDSDGFGGNDPDLEQGFGNVLIVQEREDLPPDDSASGGSIIIDFDNPTDIFGLRVLDTENPAKITTTVNGNDLATIESEAVANGTSTIVAIKTKQVDQLRVKFPGSGALDTIRLCLPCINSRADDGKDWGCTFEAPLCVAADGTGVPHDHAGAKCVAVCESGFPAVVDFDTDATGTPIPPGSYVTDLKYGFTIAAKTLQRQGGYVIEGPRLYDSDGIGGEDTDLEQGFGNVLVIQETEGGEPDDNEQGGTIIFNFDTPTDIVRMLLLDTEKSPVLSLTTANDGPKSVVGPAVEDGQSATVDIDAEGVIEMKTKFRGSGAIGALKICLPCYNTRKNGRVDKGCTHEAPRCVASDGSDVPFFKPGAKCAPCPPPEAHTDLSVCLAIDLSKSISATELEEEKTFATTLIDEFASRVATTEYGVVGFSTKASIITKLTNAAEAKSKILQLTHTGGYTNLAHAIKKCTQVLKYAASDNRLLITITDGKPTKGDYPSDAARLSEKRGGNTLVSIGVGQVWGEQVLKDIASADSLVFGANNFAALPDIVEDILSTPMCMG